MSTQRLRWTVDPKGAFATLQGDVDEFADFARLVSELRSPRVTVDLAGVRRINSLGLRNWIRWIQQMADREVIFVRCSPAVVDQLSCIKDFRGHAKIKTVMLPFSCDKCGTIQMQELELASVRGAQKLPPGPACPTCRRPSALDDFPERYLGLAKY